MADATADPKTPPTIALPAPVSPHDASADLLVRTMQLLQQQQAGRPATATADMDETHPGGKYLIDGQLVNAWGKPFVEGQDPHKDNPELTPFNR